MWLLAVVWSCLHFLYREPFPILSVACEVAYPVSEGVTNLVLTLLNNMGERIFACTNDSQYRFNLENWCLLGAIASCIPVLYLLKERYNRLEIDETETKVD